MGTTADTALMLVMKTRSETAFYTLADKIVDKNDSRDRGVTTVITFDDNSMILLHKDVSSANMTQMHGVVANKTEVVEEVYPFNIPIPTVPQFPENEGTINCVHCNMKSYYCDHDNPIV